jgi:hypothetical protein
LRIFSAEKKFSTIETRSFARVVVSRDFLKNIRGFVELSSVKKVIKNYQCKHRLQMSTMAKQRSANWTGDEETVLVEEVGKREEILFGKIKGDGAVKIGHIRAKGWEDVAEVLNA